MMTASKEASSNRRRAKATMTKKISHPHRIQRFEPTNDIGDNCLVLFFLCRTSHANRTFQNEILSHDLWALGAEATNNLAGMDPSPAIAQSNLQINSFFLSLLPTIEERTTGCEHLTFFECIRYKKHDESGSSGDFRSAGPCPRLCSISAA